jgi:hypothetical protein
MSPRPLPSVVLFVADVERVAAFYQGVAAMQRVAAGAEHELLESPGFQLVIHRLRGEPEPTRDENGSPLVREDAYSKLCLPVDAIAAARSRALSLGGYLRPPEDEWQARDFRACDGHDPEGNVFQVRERAV